MFNSILVVTDFSPNSLKVMGPALHFARKFGADIHLCHVDEAEAALSGHSSDELVEFLNRVEARRNSWLESMANEIREQDIDCEIVRLKGWASKEIIDYAQENGISLTAISALGEQGFKSLLMGSTSANVLRNSVGPTLFVSANCSPPEDYRTTCILFPTDFSQASFDGVRYAASLAARFGAELEFFHVMKIPAFIPRMPGEAPLVMPPSLIKKIDDKFEDMVASVTDLLPEERISCEVTTGDDEAEVIAATAVAKKADLIVIPRRGQGVLEGLVFGRVAENLARISPVPTILFDHEQVELPETDE
jgi:nucleotide-binding universal stress UspA family protein